MDEFIDVEEEFHPAISTKCDDELPSTLVNLNEYSDDLYSLPDQSWSIDECKELEPCISRDKHLVEEDDKFLDIGSSPLPVDQSPSCSTAKNVRTYTRWTVAEREIFKKGMEIHGHKWSKIALMLPTKNRDQIKYFGHRLSKKMMMAEKQNSRDLTNKAEEIIIVKHNESSDEEIDILNSSSDEKNDELIVNVQPRKSRDLVVDDTADPIVVVDADDTLAHDSPFNDARAIQDLGGEDIAWSLAMLTSGCSSSTGGDIDSPPRSLLSMAASAMAASTSRGSTQLVNGQHNSFCYADSSLTNRALKVISATPSPSRPPISNRCSSTQISAPSTLSSIAPRPPLPPPSSSSTAPAATLDAHSFIDYNINNNNNNDTGNIGSDCCDLNSCDIPYSANNARVENTDSSYTEPGFVDVSHTDPSSTLTRGDVGAVAVAEVPAGSEIMPPPPAAAVAAWGGMPVAPPTSPKSCNSADESSVLSLCHAGDHLGELACSLDSDSDNSASLHDRHCQDGEEGTSHYLANDENTNDDSAQESKCSGICSMMNYKGEEIYLPIPKNSIDLDEKKITDQEKSIFKDYFSFSSKQKTEDRFLYLRNSILKLWYKDKPTYLSKSRIRAQIRKVGDVNCLGRIHTFLEFVGAINFGCSKTKYTILEPAKSRNPHSSIIPTKNEMTTRKRRVRNHDNKWINSCDLEGISVPHVEKPEPKIKVVKTENPFVQIECSTFNSQHQAPFKVVIDKLTLYNINLHSQMSVGEVIGLLGGYFNETDQVLTLSLAVVCRNVGTAIQCEMDMVSQTDATETILSLGLIVVGWYHSHPNFSSNPSVRDISTQKMFQRYYNFGSSSFNPFVGLICNPQNHSPDPILTVFMYIEQHPSAIKGEPYKFDYLTAPSNSSSYDYISSTTRILQLHTSTRNKVNFSKNSALERITRLITSFHQYNNQLLVEIMDIIYSNVFTK